MEITPLTRLQLYNPLVYTRVNNTSFQDFDEKEEVLLCFDLDPAQSLSIEPDPQRLAGAQVFTGRKTDGLQGETVTLPAGKYLFSQCRGSLPWLDLAVEQQKDALWEREKPGNRLYVRYLFEDGSRVTQVFREFAQA
jgi:hypothetical protein